MNPKTTYIASFRDNENQTQIFGVFDDKSEARRLFRKFLEQNYVEDDCSALKFEEHTINHSLWVN